MSPMNTINIILQRYFSSKFIKKRSGYREKEQQTIENKVIIENKLMNWSEQ